MKKNKMMRTASVLLVLTLLTISIISGTYAKYTTEDTGSDSAKVAKWGVVIQASGNLFGEQYTTDQTDINKGTVTADSTNDAKRTYSVKTGTVGTNVVAPGTKNETGLKLSLTGTPEVRTQLDLIVETQDIYLAKGTYAIMKQVTVTANNFATKQKNGIYTEASGVYGKVGDDATYNDKATYYVVTNSVTLSEAYYPVKFTNTESTLSPTDGKAATLALNIATKLKSGLTTASQDSMTASSIANTKYKVSAEYAPSVDTIEKLLGSDGSNTTKWSWVFSSNDPADTIIGDLIAVGSKNSTVVYADGNDYKVLKVNDSTGLVTNAAATAAEVGSIHTSFSVTISATQVD